MNVRRVLALSCTILVLGGLAFLIWPVRFGGHAMFVVVRGESMEPTYHPGELLYTRTASSFEPGDVAVYRIPDGDPGEGTFVVHRIKQVLPDGTYVFQGDNKPAPDDFRPHRDDLIGKPVVDLGDVPTRALLLLPLLLTIVTAVGVTIALWPEKARADAEDKRSDEDDRDGGGGDGGADRDPDESLPDPRIASAPARRPVSASVPRS